MRKPATGEPCAGEPHARFGGRGGSAFPTPIGEAAWHDPLHLFAGNAARPTNRCRDGNTPCNVRQRAKARCRATPRLSWTAQCGSRQSKKESTQMQADARGCTQMGLSPAWSCTAEIARPSPRSRTATVAPILSACIRVHLLTSALNLPCLLPRAPHSAARVPGRCARGRTPCTCTAARHAIAAPGVAPGRQQRPPPAGRRRTARTQGFAGTTPCTRTGCQARAAGRQKLCKRRQNPCAISRWRHGLRSGAGAVSLPADRNRRYQDVHQDRPARPKPPSARSCASDGRTPCTISRPRHGSGSAAGASGVRRRNPMHLNSPTGPRRGTPAAARAAAKPHAPFPAGARYAGEAPRSAPTPDDTGTWTLYLLLPRARAAFRPLTTDD